MRWPVHRARDLGGDSAVGDGGAREWWLHGGADLPRPSGALAGWRLPRSAGERIASARCVRQPTCELRMDRGKRASVEFAASRRHLSCSPRSGRRGRKHSGLAGAGGGALRRRWGPRLGRRPRQGGDQAGAGGRRRAGGRPRRLHQEPVGRLPGSDHRPGRAAAWLSMLCEVRRLRFQHRHQQGV